MRLARSHMMLAREQDKRLTNAQAITAAIAHEVKQPFGAISMNASAALRFLGRDPPDLDELHDLLNDVRTDSHPASDVIDSVRNLFGQSSRRLEPTDMNAIIVDVLRSLRGELADRSVAIRCELSTNLPHVDVHEGQLREVIFNLVHNAV